MAELLQSCIRHKQQTSFKRTSFAMKEVIQDEESSASRQTPQVNVCSENQEGHQLELPNQENSLKPTSETPLEVEQPSSADKTKPTATDQHVKKRLKGKQRGQVLKQPRTIAVHLHNGKTTRLTFHFKPGERKPVLRVQLVKDSLSKVLKIGQELMDLFGIFSGTTENPIKLHSNTSLLPENYSHFSLQILGFNWKSGIEINDYAMELIVAEIKNHIKLNEILPPLNKDEREMFRKMSAIKSKDISEILDTHCLTTSNEAYTQPFPSLIFATPSTKADIQLALDMKGIHLFDVTGMILIMTFPWTSISQIKCQKEPTCLFMFDIVVLEEGQFLRSIVVQTPHCAYLTSIADAILNLHCEKPELPGTFHYRGNFSSTGSKYQPYSLVHIDRAVSLKECIVNGMSHDIKRIYSLSHCISNKAYEVPHYVFEPNTFQIPSDLQGMRYNIHFRTFQVIYYSKRTYKKERNDTRWKNVDPNMIFLIIPVKEDRSIIAKEVKMAVLRTLQLKKENAELFGLFLHKSSSNTSLYLFSDEDDIPDGYYEFIFRSLVFNWSENVDPHQWSSIKEDENASKLLFWEVMCAHGHNVNEVDEILEMLINSCSLSEFVREMGAIADLHSVECVLKKIPDTIAELVTLNQKVILSVEAGWLHLWRYDTGQRIASWNWNAISTVRRETTLSERVKFEIFVPNKSGKHNHQRYQTLSVETTCASYVMTVVGYVLDGYKSHCGLVRSYDWLKKSPLKGKNKKPTNCDENMELKDIDENLDERTSGVLTTFVGNDTENPYINTCISCTKLASNGVQGRVPPMEAGCKQEHLQNINTTTEEDSRQVCNEGDDHLNRLGVNNDSLCTKIEYEIIEPLVGEFLIKYDGTNGFKFLKDVRVLPGSKLIDVVGYYWNRNFTGSMGKRHQHKVLANPRDIVSFRTILPDDGLFPVCYLELPQCCISVSVPHLIRPLTLLARMSRSDGRKYFSCFSTKPYRYRL